MIRFVPALLLLATSSLPAQSATSIERVAALRYAMANGFEIPADAIVVVETATEPNQPRPPATREEFRSADARALARELGESARTAAAKDAVACKQRFCHSLTATPVVVASDPELGKDGETTVLVRVIGPAADGVSVHTQAVIVVKRAGDGWVGEKFRLGPATLRVRIPSTL
jgi:hypothetical protein